MNALLQDLRYGLRVLAKSPSFALAAVVALGLAIGVNTAVFTGYNAVALRPLQARDPSRVVNVYLSTGHQHYGNFFSYPAYAYYRDHNNVLSGLVAIAIGVFSMSGSPAVGRPAPTNASIVGGFRLPGLLTAGNAEPLVGVFVSENYFETLGVPPAMGRSFLSIDGHGPGSDPVVLLSYNYWEQRFNSDRGLIGKTLKLNGVSLTVIGIMPRDFMGTSGVVPNVWVPLTMQPLLQPGIDWLHDHKIVEYSLFARLKTGVTRRRAEEEMTSLALHLRQTYPEGNTEGNDARITLTRGSAFGHPPAADEMAVIAFALTAVALVLVIACANVSGLLLARAVARQKEIAVRLSLGATRRRLVRQLLTESLLIGVAAGGVGLLLSWWLIDLLTVKVAGSLPVFLGTTVFHLAPDSRVFAYTLLLGLVATVGCGLLPAVQATKPDLTAALKQEATGLNVRLGRRRYRLPLREVLVALQVGACAILLITAGLMARGSQKALTLDLGFDPKKLVLLSVNLPSSIKYDLHRRAAIEARLIERLQSLPGVKSTAVAVRGPLVGGLRSVAVRPEGRGADALDRSPQVYYSIVSPRFFEAIGIPTVRGRAFTEEEARSGAAVAIVSEALARRYWPGKDPLGKRLSIGELKARPHFAGDETPYSPSSVVIGVAVDLRSVSLQKRDEAYLYLPLNPHKDWGHIYLRAEYDPKVLMATVGSVVQSVDPNLIAFGWEGEAALTNDPAFVLARLGAILSGIVGLLGLVMAAVGIYSTVSYAVAQRTREIGVRMALGARGVNVLRSVLWETVRAVTAGVALGLVGGGVASRVLSALLFGMNAFDPLVFVGVPAFLGAVTVVASYIPARRATKVDPMVALRYE